MSNWIVSKDESGMSLLQFLKKNCRQEISLKKLKAAIEKNACLVNKRVERFASYVLGKGDFVEFRLEVLETIIPFQKERILYEDASLLFYDKPPGVVSDSKKWLEEVEKIKPGLHLIHRLDKETSGVLLFSKSLKVKEELISQFKEQSVEKEYLALVDGILQKAEGVIENYLGSIKRLQGQVIFGEKVKGQFAKTIWKKLKTGRLATLLSCFPVTGRTHQIRVHLNGIGHPILGDWQYARNFKCPFIPKRILLHARSLLVCHPETHQKLEVISPIPEDMLQAMEKLICMPSSLKPLL